MTDLDILIKALDDALMSDNPAVKNALRSLLVLTALTIPEDGGDTAAGPLRTLVDEQIEIRKRLHNVEQEMWNVKRNQGPPVYGAGGTSTIDDFYKPYSAGSAAMDKWKKKNGLV